MMQITSDWLLASGTQSAMSMLTQVGYQAYVVGGCVRNDLLGVPVSDVDISTNARPETVMDLAKHAGFKVIPTGIDHGTVTVVIKGEPFEITTFRADVETDGRRAVVSFAQTLQEDCLRRDFTMNALYADQNGRISDPVNGMPDLIARRFVFIQDAATRIREDYLRVLRYFRFMAWYGDPEDGFDSDTLAAIAGNLDGLPSLSRERVGSEMTKLLGAETAAFSIGVMGQIGVLNQILPGCDTKALAPFEHISQQLSLPIDPIASMAVLGLREGAVLRLSKADQRKLALFHDVIEAMDPLPAIAFEHGAEIAKQVLAMRGAMFEQMPMPDDLAKIEDAAHQLFPLSAKDLMPDWQGKALGVALKEGKRLWIRSEFLLSKDDILVKLKKMPPKG